MTTLGALSLLNRLHLPSAVTTQYELNYLPTSIVSVLITILKVEDPDQAGHNLGSDLDPIYLIL